MSTVLDDRPLLEPVEIDRQLEPKVISPKQARLRWGIGSTYLYDLIADGTLKSVRVGGRRFISVECGDALFGA